MNATMKRITDMIKKEMGAEYETMVVSYIFDKGYSFCKEITDADIAEIEENGMMTKEFVQSLVRCARDLTDEFELYDLMKYIRCELWMTPVVKEMRLCKSDVSEDVFDEICEALEIEDEDVTEMDSVTIKVICEEG